jgi:hypothetical protein
VLFKGKMGKAISSTKSHATTGLYKPSGTHRPKPGSKWPNGQAAGHEFTQFQSKLGGYTL